MTIARVRAPVRSRSVGARRHRTLKVLPALPLAPLASRARPVADHPRHPQDDPVDAPVAAKVLSQVIGTLPNTGDPVHDGLTLVQRIRRFVDARYHCGVLGVSDTLLVDHWRHGWHLDGMEGRDTPTINADGADFFDLPPKAVPTRSDGLIHPAGRVFAVGWTDGTCPFTHAIGGQVRYSLDVLGTILAQPRIAPLLAYALYGVAVRLAVATTASRTRAVRYVVQEVAGRVHFIAQDAFACLNRECSNCPERANAMVRYQGLIAAFQAKEWAAHGGRLVGVFSHAG